MTTLLFATSEARPLIKTGGLADVSGALPAALRGLGIDCRLLIPGYQSVLNGVRNLAEVARFNDLKGFGEVRLLAGEMPDNGVPVYVIDYPWHYLRAGGPYQDVSGHDYPDSAWRFALLSRVAAILSSDASPIDWRADILHCNDWQTGLAPAYLKLSGGALGNPAPSLMTIHNLAYQGIFPPNMVGPLDLPVSSFGIGGVEYYGNLSFLKAGLYYADWISTVSPSYAEEIQGPELGMGMQGLLTDRRAQLTGIVNGIDILDWNPSADPHLPHHFSVRGMAGKKRCKQALQADLNLNPDADAPLFGLISRLTYQKGLDWLIDSASAILDRGGQLVVLGTGEPGIESAFRDLAAHNPGRVSATIGYDEGLSHRIEAAADMFLMPSRFEPCGLNQMYSLRYGTVPVVHATGGLRDTVEDGVTGFVFQAAEAHALRAAIHRALDTFADAKAWKAMIKAGMQRDFSWEKSAGEYAALYRRLLGQA